MASPHAAGAMAIVQQALKARGMTDATQRKHMVDTLLMSTASIIYDSNGQPYSPRKQGAGLININDAVKTEGYLTVDGMIRPKLELGDDPAEKGVYTMTFKVHNTGKDTLYSVSYTHLDVYKRQMEKDGFRETLLEMYSHTGTHMDAPAHMLPSGRTLDDFPAETFAGRGFVVDCRGAAEITLPMLRRQEEALGEAEFLLFCTGWDRYWGQPRYYEGFPCLTAEAAEYVASLGLKLSLIHI